MWLHPATQRNLRDAEGATASHVVGPNEGAMAEASTGPGRMAEPLEIVAAIEGARWRARRRRSRASTCSSPPGPTHEPIDPVRYIANRSSGKQGHAIAARRPRPAPR